MFCSVSNRNIIITSRNILIHMYIHLFIHYIGWEEAIDVAGRIYYIDHNTQTTTYNDPRFPGEQQTPTATSTPISISTPTVNTPTKQYSSSAPSTPGSQSPALINASSNTPNNRPASITPVQLLFQQGPPNASTSISDSNRSRAFSGNAVDMMKKGKFPNTSSPLSAPSSPLPSNSVFGYSRGKCNTPGCNCKSYLSPHSGGGSNSNYSSDSSDTEHSNNNNSKRDDLDMLCASCSHFPSKHDTLKGNCINL